MLLYYFTLFTSEVTLKKVEIFGNFEMLVRGREA